MGRPRREPVRRPWRLHAVRAMLEFPVRPHKTPVSQSRKLGFHQGSTDLRICMSCGALSALNSTGVLT